MHPREKAESCCRSGIVKTYHTSVVLEVKEDTVEALPGLGLPDNDGGVDLLPELGLSLLDGGHDHVTDTTGGQAVKAGTNTLDGDDVKVASTGVVAAVHDGTDGKTEGHLELATGGTTSVREKMLVFSRSLAILMSWWEGPRASSFRDRGRRLEY